jgi:hypothetical protein
MSTQKSQAALDSSDSSGKKVFLLYPHSVIREEMLDDLIMNGFETYTLFDHKKAVKILERFPGSSMFINIDTGISENEWEAYIKSIQENPKTRETRLGILSYNQDKSLMEKYLMDLNVPCGYIQLKLGIQESTLIIHNALHANEVNGRRKYLRAFCEDEPRATMNYKSDEGFFQGKILDISVAGIAAKIPKFPGYKPHALLAGVQLNLKGALVMVDAILVGKRGDRPDVYIMLFDPSKMKLSGKQVIHHFIKQNLQKYIDQLKI